ncbi:prepilin-type N-terminal cleavage/methylation domain-containing protein [Cyanobacteria bacterium 150NLHA]|nr:putative major pilin subunit [Prochlorococcus marinus str. MIT 1312]KZR81562.1 putative major pilin subunit [Prochlorococcus marinus str. MIT 1327]NMO83078.1 prepilin-type N-terminal cleavage/methylation domain-containing protein [Prochlorococcus sp. P1344]NMP05723.1 prepilin-type N-terminal cleavage/methylation domain-containing protein [Prochlorococcus sp. P1361]NMP13411.1 prepilin-type N-terminal cleavage/methylation domain-containing protein [Prochlorococcus sp.P1363]
MKYLRYEEDHSQGYSLLELLVVITIVSILSAYGLPKFRRNVAQGQVDRYTQFIESGLFSLRARLGQSKTSCRFSLDQDLTQKTFGPPWLLLEFQQPDGSQSNSQRLKCCWNQDGEIVNCTPDLLKGKSRYRFLTIEGSRESKEVEVSATQASYELSPPGTSAQRDNLTILVRSRHSAQEPLLRTRCVELSGNGQIHSGTWNDDTGFCDSS